MYGYARAVSVEPQVNVDHVFCTNEKRIRVPPP